MTEASVLYIAMGCTAIGFLLLAWYAQKKGTINTLRVMVIGAGMGIGFFVGTGILFFLEEQGIFDFHVITPPILRMIPIVVSMIVCGIIADYVGKRRGYLPFM